MPGVRVSTKIEDGAVVMGNATDLRRVFNNIIENARRYGKSPGGEVTEIDICCDVKLLGNGRCAVVVLQDHGPGVPDDQIEQLLKPFTRLDSARGQANGAGLGLAIVERVLLRHDAALDVSNRQGGGLRIQITMVLADDSV